MWADSPRAYLGHQPTEKFPEELDDTEKQVIIAQQCLRSKMIGLWIKNSLATDAGRKLRDFRSAYTINTQDDGAAMFFVI